jgi:hypothetical protein
MYNAQWHFHFDFDFDLDADVAYSIQCKAQQNPNPEPRIQQTQTKAKPSIQQTLSKHSSHLAPCTLHIALRIIAHVHHHALQFAAGVGEPESTVCHGARWRWRDTTARLNYLHCALKCKAHVHVPCTSLRMLMVNVNGPLPLVFAFVLCCFRFLFLSFFGICGLWLEFALLK